MDKDSLAFFAKWHSQTFAAVIAIVNGLLEQDVIDRTKLTLYIQNLLATMTPEKRESPYGVALEKALEAFERLEPFDPTDEWRH